jgi:anti-sigma B factor antagonist
MKDEYNERGGHMALKTNVRQTGNVSIVDMAGRITLGEECAQLRETLKNLRDNGSKAVVLNVKDVTYIDSAGLGELVGAYASMSNAGGEIKLLNVGPKVGDLLQVTKLFTVFANYTDEGEAVRSFGSAAGA